MKNPSLNLKLSFVAVICLFVCPTAFAQVMSSPHYSMEAESVNFAGGNSVSSNYGVESTAGEAATGFSSSAHNIVSAGYQLPAVPSTPTPTTTPPTPVIPPTSSSGSSSGGGGYVIPLPNPSGFYAVGSDNGIDLSWSNPIDPRFISVRIMRSNIFFPSGPNDGQLIYEGTEQSFFDASTTVGKTYYYAIFAEGTGGLFSSGALASAHVLSPGESPSIIPSGNPFANIPMVSTLDPMIARLSLPDFEFIQEGVDLPVSKAGMITVDGMEDLTIRLPYSKVPQILKTIAVALNDPQDSSRAFVFLLRANADKTYYEATIGSLGRSGDYPLSITVLDYQNRGLKKLGGDVNVMTAAAVNAIPQRFFENLSSWAIPVLLMILAIIIIVAIFLIVRKRRNASKVLTVLLLALSASMCGAFIHTAYAAFNQEINYQGKLMDASNNAVADGNYNVRFGLYTAASGGSPIWTETDVAPLKSGLFSTMLGSVAPFTGVDFNQTLYLGVEIGGSGAVPAWDGEMTPRKILGAVPAAFVAGNALTADTALTANTALTADSLSGVLGVGSGGTGTSTVPTFGKILMGNGFGGYDLMSTSSMNIMSTGFSGTTDNVTEGLTNLYYHNSLVNSYINGSSTIAKLYTANTWNALQTFGNNISLGGAQLNMGALALGNLMSYNGTNWVNVATSTLNLSIPLASTTGTLGVANGGTGQTSFGQGWIGINNSGAFISSTSPTVAYITATSTTVASTFPILRDGEIADQHADGSWTYTIATTSTDVGRGNALLYAVSQAQNGDSFYLSANTFDIGSSYIDLSNGNSGTLNLHGSGKYLTVITSSNSSNSAALVNVGLGGSSVSDMSIEGTGTNVAAFGMMNNVPVSTTTIQNVYLQTGGTGIYWEIGDLEAKNISINVGGIGISFQGKTLANLSNLVINAGQVCEDTADFLPYVNIYDMQCTAPGGTGIMSNIYNSYGPIGATTNVYGGSFSTRNAFVDYSNSLINVSSDTVYDPTTVEGTIHIINNPALTYSLGQASSGTNGQILETNGVNSSWVSTSSLNINTDNLVQGNTNKFYTDALVNSYVSGSSTIAKLYTANAWNALQTFGNNISLGGAQLNMGALAYGNLMSYNGTNWVNTATSSLNLTVPLASTTGTLGIANGGTGQTSFGQGWLNSNGTTISASTSPTVAYITATSTTASSTLQNTEVAQLKVGSLSGFLKGIAGTVSTSLINLASDISGILGVANGGTGWGAFTAGNLIYGNGTGALATSSNLTFNGTTLTANALNVTGATTLASSLSGLLLGTNGVVSSISTSSLNINTDNLVQGNTNKFYADSLVNSYINGSSTIAKLYTANAWNALQTFGNNISLGGAQLNMGALAYGNLMSYNGTNWVNTATSSLNLTVPLASTTGTLGIANGGTGQTSFGQGWLNSNGTTISASTSPTVAYITATSTTATSTLPNLSVNNLTVGSHNINLLDYLYAGTKPYVSSSRDLTNAFDLSYRAGDATSTTLNGIGYIHGSLIALGYFFGANINPDGSQTTPVSIVRVNINDMTQTLVPVPSGIGCYNMGELTYVPSQTKIYGICGSGQIIQIDPYTLAISQVATLGPAYFTPPSITNDGSYLYTVSSNAVVKISLSDFSTVYAGYGSFFAGTYVLGHNIKYDGTNLYMTDGNSYIFKIDPSNLTSPTIGTITNSNPLYVTGPITDDMAITPDYIYLGMEQTNYIVRVSKADLSQKFIPVSGHSYGLYFDGQYIWDAEYNVNRLLRLDPITLQTMDFPLNSGGAINELEGDGQRLFYTTYTGPAVLYRIGMPQTVAGSSLAWNDINQGTLMSLDYNGATGVTFGDGITQSSTTAISTFAGNVGIGTTSPLNALSVAGNGLFTGNITGANIAATGTLSVTATTTTGGLSLGSLSGFLKAAAGAVSTSLMNLGTDITGILGVGSGGTGVSSFTTGDLIYGNGSGALATSSNLTFDGTTLSVNTLSAATICLTGDSCKTAWPTGGSGGGASGTWSTTTSSVPGELINYSNNNNYIAAIGGVSTTTAKYWFDPNTQVAYLSGNVGIGTSSPYAPLSVNGQAVASYFTATASTASIFPYASTTALTVSGLASTSNLVASNSFTLSNFSGLLYGTNGSVGTISTSSLNINLSNMVGALGVNHGGTGQTSFGQGWLGINNSGAFVSSTSPTVAYITATSTAATSTFAGGLNVSGSVGIGTTSLSAKLSVNGNISNILSPTSGTAKVGTVAVGSFFAGSGPRSVYISGHYAYVINSDNNTLYVVDVSNPSSPTVVGTTAVGNGPTSVYVSGRYAYVTNSYDSTLSVIDVSNPSSPVSVGTATVGSYPNSVYVSGRYAYVANSSSNTLSIVDVSNPSSPVSVGTVVVGSIPNSVYVSGRYAYVTNSYDSTLSVIDVSNPSSPVSVGTVTVGSYPNSVYVSGRYAYVVGSVLSVVNISNPSSPVLVGTAATGGGNSVFVSGRYAYVPGGGALSVIDVSNPSSPVSVGTAAAGSSPVSVYVSGRYAYVANIDDGTLSVTDITGIETTSLMAGSIQAGNIQSLNDIISGGQIQSSSLQVGIGGILSNGALSISNTGTSTFGGPITSSSISSPSGNLTVASAGTTNNLLLNPYGGNVGIGMTTNPAYQLEVNGSAGIDGGLVMTGNLSMNLGQAIYLNGPTNSDMSILGDSIGLYGHGSQALVLNPGFHDKSTIVFASTTGSNYDHSIYFDNTGIGVGVSYSGGGHKSMLDVAGNMSLGAYAGVNAAPTNGLIVSGNVGIGTSSPQGLLDVVGSSNSISTAFDGSRAMSIINTNTTNGNMAGFDYRTNDANGVLTTGAKIMAIFGSHAAGAVSSDLAFRVNNAGTIGEAMRITAAGNVGIGTTSPYAPLSVNGQIVGAYFTATTTATSTFGGNLAINGTGTTTSTGGFNISAGCFAVNGTCLGGSSYGDANVNSYVNGSSTIAKLYTANTWNALQTFGNNISLGGAQLSMGSLSSGNLMSYNGTNWVNVATSSLNLSIPLASTTGTLGVGNGGTGATSFGQGWIYSNGGTGALSASTSPTVAYVMATSTTATSTLPLLSVTTALSLTGKLYDSLNSAGSNGYVLQSTGSGTQWVATSSLGLSLNSTPNIQIFSTTGANTWTKPAGASVVEVVIYGGGGQGGGGDGNAAGTTRIGGSGGGGGAQNMRTFNAADLGSSETVTIGAGGTTGGTGGTNGVGTAGQGGGVTTFGSYISAYGGGGGGGGLGSCTGAIFGGGGGGRGSAGLVGAAGTSISNGGSPGVANTATALGGEGGTGSNGNAEYGGGGGGAGSCTAVAGGNGGSSLFGGPGGGGGGGIKVDNTTSLGGPGGAPNSYVAGTGAAHNASGTAGSSSSAGSGAGGGDSNGSGTGTAGGAGGNVGAGGGGGGGGTTTGGAGGAGGNGYAVVITWTTSGSSQWSASGNNISYSAGNVGIGTTTPGNADLFGVAGNVYIGGAGTSTVQNNLDVLGTFHSKLSYTGDLFFANNFSFTEAPLDGTPQGLLLKNQNGSRILSIDENGNLSVPGDICAGSATSTLGSQCLGQSLQAFSSRLDALASSTAEFDIASTTYTGIASTTIDISTQVAAIDLKVDALASSTVTFADLASSTASIASTTAAKLASSTPFIQTIANAVVALLQSSGQVISSAATWTVNEIHATLAVFTDVKTNTIETQTAAVSNGLEMTDSATGAVYCVKITNGDFAKVPGSCVAEATSTPAVNNQLPITNYQIQNSTTAVFATTTMPLISTTTITSTTMPIISTTTPIMVAPMSTGTTTPVISADPSVSTPPVPPIVPPVATSTSTVEPVIPSAPVDESATPVTPIQTPTTAPTGGGQ